MSTTFGEREAIKKRLNQVEQLEREIKRHFRLERNQLVLRLNIIEALDTEYRASSLKLQRRKARVTLLQETIVRYLKQENRPVRGFAVQRYVEDRTGHRIGNVSAFMNALMPKYKEVRKIGRGMYVYENKVLVHEKSQTNGFILDKEQSPSPLQTESMIGFL